MKSLGTSLTELEEYNMTDLSTDKQFSLDQIVNLQVLDKKDDSEILRYSQTSAKENIF